MGIFSQKPRIPDPYISIVYDDHMRGPCYPGSQVSGIIKLQSPAPRHIEYAQVSFFGHAMTASYETENASNRNNSRRTIYFRDDASLFYFDQTMFANFGIEQDQTYTPRFQFQFPHSCGRVDASPYIGRTAESGFYTTESHALPPAFAVLRSEHEYAVVEYRIQFTVKFQDKKDPLVIDYEALNFVPHNPRPENPPLSEFVKPSQKYSSSRLMGGAKSISHSFRDKFSSDTPSVNLTMKTTLPPLVTTSASFPIYACIEIDSLSDPNISIPPINVKISNLKLCQYTFYRSLLVHTYSFHAREHQSVHDETVLLNAVPEWRQVERQDGKAGGRSFTFFPAAFEARIPGATCPSFQTFNINHNFQLEFKLEAEVCEKKFEFKVEVPGVVVFPT